MEGDVCEGCGAQSVGLDYEAGVMVCDSCGLVRQEIDLRRAEFDKEGGSLGTYVGGVGTVASVGGRSAFASDTYKIDIRRNYTFDRLHTVGSLVRLPKDKMDDVKHMLGVVTDQKWGSGSWIDILIATCVYIVARQSQLPLLAAEIADTIGCTVVEIFKMYSQVCHLMKLENPAISQSIFFDRIVFHSSAFTSLGRDTLRKLCKQGHCLMEIGFDWSLSTGRRPSSIAAAAVVLISRANNIRVNIEEISRDLHIHPNTTRARLKEFLDYLVCFGQRLPWGKDITSKTVIRHLPFLLQYCHRTITKTDSGKLSENDVRCVMPRKKTTVFNGAAAPAANSLCAKYGQHTKQVLNSQALTLKEEHSMVLFGESTSSHAVGQGHEEETITNQPFVKDLVLYGDGMDVPDAKRRKMSDDDIIKEGTAKKHGVVDNIASCPSEASQKWQPLPPCFVAGVTANSLRAAKIQAVKERIGSVKRDIVAQLRREKVLSNEKSTYVSLPCQSDSNSRRALDAEDMLIQYCLLRGGNEKLLEAGYYSHVLYTPPVQPDESICSDKDLLQYFNTPNEVEFLKSISEGEPPYPWLTNDELNLLP